MPAAVLSQARHTLEALEQQATKNQAQVDLFAAPVAAEMVAASAIDTTVAGLNPDAMSPREALEALYQLKALAQSV
jgi:DNA mismatch repair protein MutS